jgi:hypothetical protein
LLLNLLRFRFGCAEGLRQKKLRCRWPEQIKFALGNANQKICAEAAIEAAEGTQPVVFCGDFLK